MRSEREHASGATNVVQRKEATSAPAPGPGKQSLIERTFPAVQRKSSGTEGLPDDQVHEAAQAGVSGPGGAMPHGDKIQAAFGDHDISGVKAHVGGQAADASKAIGAEAYATGNNIAFGNSPDLHTAAHEAAHVVQQRAGVHLKGGVGAEGDAHEQHADAVADAVVAGKSAAGLLDQYKGGGGGAAVQRRAVKESELAGAHADGNDAIFDSKVKTGHKFKISAQIAAPDYTKVIAKYHELIRPIGNAMAGHQFTDKKISFQNNIPRDKAKWGTGKVAFFKTALPELDMPNGAAEHPEFDYWSAMATAAKTPGGLLNHADVGLIDPFVLAVEIKDSTNLGKPPWLVVTQFAFSGSGYIKKIYNGAQEYGGEITTKQDFNATKDTAAATKSDFKYSSTHDQGSDSFDHRMGGMGPDKGKVGDNGAGLDAVTWLAAEGARFAPVAALGGAGSPESHYFVKPHADWAGYKYLTAADLMQCWKDAFKMKYGVSKEEIAAVVNSARGKTAVPHPPKGAHYNLLTGARHDQP
ncbi:MAG TPA: DUF4157 domain-containing protein [Kofleriaceae bacterium]